MPATKQQQARVMVQANLPWRRLLGRRTVRRTVQGVDLVMPWSHMLPDYARMRPTYGQNLVELAAGLAAKTRDFTLLDVGANIGDSTAQILDRTGGRALCVEADPYWIEYLRRNVGTDPRVSLEEALLTVEEGDWAASIPIRDHGTTHFVQDTEQTGVLPARSIASLRAAHPYFDRLRLVKSDTDGFDVSLVPAIAEAWRDSAPVLFFEYDPILSRAAGATDPSAVWPALAALGYTEIIAWDNMGDPLGRMSVADAPAHAASLEPRPIEFGYHFWDVAVCRPDDAVALETFAHLVPQEFSVRGTWR